MSSISPIEHPNDASPPSPKQSAARRTRRDSKRPGIRQVAQLADVSVATVSMVINDNPKITEATRRKVTRVMKQVGYQPNRHAQSLSSKYTRSLSVLMPTLRHALADPYFGEVVSGIVDRADKLGHKVMLEHAKPDFIRENRHLELFERRFVDGVLCIGFGDRHGFLQDFCKHGYPCISVNNLNPDWELNHVVCDYPGGASQVMTYLHQLGHRRIGLIHGAPTVYTARSITEVYRSRMAEIGVAVDDTWLADGRFTEEHGVEAAKRLLTAHPDLTAIFAGNDKMALGAMYHAAQTGRRVPDDLSIVGFDDIVHMAYTTPSLTTVHTPLYELGSLACERLVQLIRGKVASVSETLSTHLVLRGSTSIAPHANREQRTAS